MNPTPLAIVNKRMEAYNAHDIETFMSTYADSIKIIEFPNEIIGQGKAHMRSIFEPYFDAQRVRVDIHHQIEKDSYVINHETVYYNSNSEKPTEYVSIYEVRNGQIESVTFVRD